MTYIQFTNESKKLSKEPLIENDANQINFDNIYVYMYAHNHQITKWARVAIE